MCTSPLQISGQPAKRLCTSRNAQAACVPLAVRASVSGRRRLRLAPVRVLSVSEDVSASTTVSVSVDSPPVEAKVPWYKKPCPGFKEVSNVEELLAAISPQGNGGRMTVIDFYAGWCACCKSSFPALCRLPSSEFLNQHYNFYKANIEEGDLASYIKRRGVRGIPHIMVFNADGSHIIGMGGSFKKMDALRRNLDSIARAEPGERDFVLDPNGLVMRR